MNILPLLFPGQCLDLVFVSIEDILLTATEICMHLSWKKSIFRDIGVP